MLIYAPGFVVCCKAQLK